MKYIFMCVLSALSVSAFSADKLNIATFPIPLMVESKDKGIFIELSKAIAKEAGFDLSIKVLPPQRTLKEFEMGNVDAIFPALSITMPTKYEASDSVYIKRDYAFTLKGQPSLATIADLSGKRVAITSGYPYAQALTSDTTIRFDKANSDEQNVKKLLAGRVNAFVVEEKSGLKAFLNDGSESKISYNQKQPLSEQEVFYAFQKSAQGKKYADRISSALKILKANGSFSRIMSQAQ